MSIQQALESAMRKNVLFVGDTIIDEYQFVQPLMRAAKENLVPVRYLEREKYSGGVDAAASHARDFCAGITIASSGPAVRKSRFIDKTHFRKLFEAHYHDGHGGRQWPMEFFSFDCVAVCDFGHGEITDTAVFDAARYLAVSVQANSANFGYNVITKYKGADYVVIDEPEARLAAQDRDSSIAHVMQKLATGRIGKLVVTHGINGAYALEGERFLHRPAIGPKAIDTMGAGDAFFAVTAPLAEEVDLADLLTIGNAAASLKCQIIGHRESVTKAKLLEFLEAHGHR